MYPLNKQTSCTIVERLINLPSRSLLHIWQIYSTSDPNFTRILFDLEESFQFNKHTPWKEIEPMEKIKKIFNTVHTIPRGV